MPFIPLLLAAGVATIGLVVHSQRSRGGSGGQAALPAAPTLPPFASRNLNDLITVLQQIKRAINQGRSQDVINMSRGVFRNADPVSVVMEYTPSRIDAKIAGVMKIRKDISATPVFDTTRGSTTVYALSDNAGGIWYQINQ